MFRKILIANRGEIALRIIRTCKRLRIKTVAVYSEPDLESRHVTSADEAYQIGSGPPSESYLNIEKIVRAAKKSGVEAVHPGYGFLAENADFAKACEEARLAFIGPSNKILANIANKFESKRLAKAAGVPVVPGANREVESVGEAEAEARKIGFPVLLKAAFGGGGRGMRIARTVKELVKGFETARSEADTGFGHPELYVEKFLEEPRHIEVQILAGPRARVVNLGERECSLQRRYQKILEETPSPALDQKRRRRLISLALRVIRATHYENAGTVEFVMSKHGEFYYLETNKRIQVEHLISEMVTGIDIVEKQLMMASEHRLDLSQNEIEFTGAAMNCRINAEDPARGFLPSPGRVEKFVPPGGPGIRVDTALYDGAFVPEYYDSLVAKIATQGLNRTQAVERMRVALSETVVEGIRTTIPVHQTILENVRFLRGNYHVQFLDKILSGWKTQLETTPEEIAAVYLAIKRTMNAAPQFKPQVTGARSPWRSRTQEPKVGKQPLYVEGL
ncbi:MAG TPA: acetyl-CoA carboxylase biotin carboxylase subunit [Candidatus Angelobacter sp.]|nr:acetyl-CoA carboxylase biotin carboxylase subunit [Candidatus Angelobacter sp.]